MFSLRAHGGGVLRGRPPWRGVSHRPLERLEPGHEGRIARRAAGPGPQPQPAQDLLILALS